MPRRARLHTSFFFPWLGSKTMRNKLCSLSWLVLEPRHHKCDRRRSWQFPGLSLNFPETTLRCKPYSRLFFKHCLSFLMIHREKLSKVSLDLFGCALLPCLESNSSPAVECAKDVDGSKGIVGIFGIVRIIRIRRIGCRTRGIGRI